ncbi:hypothetical protein [Sphingobacterium paucimobilis]|uniref:Immunity protein 30 domain-containing protein n=1 Tax=Sphingobacterium paucimobilis HER1398 TaxID=1346330 RepID=U2J189_9SPHI|nr:hypothetical protein [Sphingobacterium paucimobilis]ERJ58724.1 hypothetical protein M472_08080 [Sphingobacterium paucimobilis HER1398]
MDIETLVQRLNAINPNDESLYEVDAIIALLNNLDVHEAKKAIEPLLKIFERLDEGHYDGVLWSIIHGIEGLKEYEDDLIVSVNRCPNEYNLLMINRILNSGQRTFKSTDYLSLLQDLHRDNKLSPYLKGEIGDYIDRHS